MHSDPRTDGRLAEEASASGAFLTHTYCFCCLKSSRVGRQIPMGSFLCSTPTVLVAVTLCLSRTRTIYYSYRRHPLHRGSEMWCSRLQTGWPGSLQANSIT